MNIYKATKRDRKQFKNKHGMKTSGKSVFAIQQAIINRAEKVQKQSKGK